MVHRAVYPSVRRFIAAEGLTADRSAYFFGLPGDR